MIKSYSFAFALAIALAVVNPSAMAQDTPKPAVSTTLVPPKPAVAAAAASASTTQPAAAAKPAVVQPAPLQPATTASVDNTAKAATAQIVLPKPTMTLPATPPTIAVASVPAATKLDPNAPKLEAQAATPKKVKLKKKKKTIVPTLEAKVKAAPPARAPGKFFFGWFDAKKPELEALSEEQVVYDQKLAAIPEKKKFKVKAEFVPTKVPFSGYKPGTIVIDTGKRYLYFVESPISAVRYGVAVGKEGLLFTGKATVGAKQPWPRWIPTKEMVERDPGHYAKYEDEGMDGGPENPLGARAIYLYQGKQDTYLRIHGTNQPQSIGSAASNGCFRMINDHVIDLYQRVGVGAEVVVL